MTRAVALLPSRSPSPPVRAAEEATVALNFQDVDVAVLARFVSEVTGRNFIVDERVHGKATIICRRASRRGGVPRLPVRAA
jgi:general secretion pathway protein D